jgi:hypothetical protein
MAFHEKAVRCQVGTSSFLLVTVSQAELPLPPPFHPHSRGLMVTKVMIARAQSTAIVRILASAKKATKSPILDLS